MAEQYTVKAGDTLWDLYGSNWRELSGYSGDPTKLQIGTKLPMPPTLKYDPTGIGQQLLQGGGEIGTPPARGVDTGSLFAQLGGLLNMSQEQFNQLIQGGEQQKKEPSIWDKLLGKKQEIEETRPTQQTYEGLLSQFGFTPESIQRQQQLQGQMVEWQKQIQDLEAQKSARLLAAEDEMAGRLTSALRGEQALIERKYNSEISAKSAQASVTAMQYEMERGMMEDAFKMADKYMEFALFEYNQKLDDLNWIKDIYTEMTAEEERAWEREYSIYQDQRDFAFKKEQAELDKYFREQGLALDWAQESRLSGGGGDEFTFFDENIQSFINEGMSPSQAAIATAGLYDITDLKQIENLKQRASRMSAQLTDTTSQTSREFAGGLFGRALKWLPTEEGKRLGLVGGAYKKFTNFWDNLFSGF